MAQDRPTASELLSAIADFLREEALPALDRAEPRLGFQMRVAVNSLAILERESRLGPAADARERERLVKLLDRELIADAVDELERRLQLYRNGSRPMSPAGRTAIVIDQAITSGHAAAGAIELLRQAGARSVVVAAPLASEPGLARLSPLAERVVALHRMPEVGPLDRHYVDWRQITHGEALACLEKARE